MMITIQDAKSTAAIAPTGAQLLSLKDSSGKEYIWQRNPAYWKNCSPLLFPAIGNSRNNQTYFDGAAYEMPKHGFCKESVFDVYEQTDSSVSFRLAANEMTRRHYPYDFVLTLTYRLENGVLSMIYTVENSGDCHMPYCLGAHPGFNCPLEHGASFEDYQLIFELEENTKSIVYDLEAMEFDVKQHRVSLENTRILPLHHQLFDQDAIYFDKIKSRKVSLVHAGTGHGVEVSYPGFESVAFWSPTGKDAPLLCVEPWNGSAICSDEDDVFIHKHGVLTLKPGESKSHLLQIRMI